MERGSVMVECTCSCHVGTNGFCNDCCAGPRNLLALADALAQAVEAGDCRACVLTAARRYTETRGT